ncbi:MAG: LysR family transcriptional regulator [Gemmatimonadetes bacterium]|nr:LysR family transcriptional regulator [Gemmatimonadota bacterium]NIQ52987.1 LysR family transcriptional regulator [Gemmatimonadota bacterium]NIU73131.1 LysR family transcriptional regulator [Gammaproteobacteria bacterium]NIX43436.1 LysR family transcriptional regulator [Gemmatimonadota bacterium]NIY07612.1 LysR family transcriptional regulator [Gemmatimonadota bacterium]
MPSLNYRRLHYFRTVAHEGSVTAAAEVLHVSQPSISVQIQKLEKTLGQRLFDRSGRSLELTAEGKVVLEYADEIFRLGRELEETVRGRLRGRPMRLVVGMSATVPNLVAFHLLSPVFGLDEPVRLVLRENRTDRLLGDLSMHEVDLVLADMPIPPNVSVQAFNHPLGSSPIDLFGPPLLAYAAREGFPQSLDGQPFLLPGEGYALRRSLDDWFMRHEIRPRVVAEVEDIDLINVLAEAGAGLFAAPSIIADDLRVRYAVEQVGRAHGVTEEFYAITVERRIKHPAIVAIREAARNELAEAMKEEE